MAREIAAVGLGEVARELGIPVTTVKHWVDQGHVKVLQEPEGPGKPKLLDRDSVLRYYKQRRRLDPRHKKRAAPPPLRTPRPPPANPTQVLGGSKPTPTSARRSASSSTSTSGTPTPSSTSMPTSSRSSRASSPGLPGPSPSAAETLRRPTADFIEEYLADCKAANNSGATLDTQRYVIPQFAEACPLMPPTRLEVIGYLEGLTVANTTKLRRFGRIKTFLYWLRDNYKLDLPRLNRILVGVKDPLPSHLTEEELRLVLDYPQTFHDKSMVNLLAETGMRGGELCSLTQGNVYPDRVMVRGKTGEHSYVITPPTYEALRNMGQEHVFWDDLGNPLTTRGVAHRVEKVFLACGITHVKMGPHTFRHTFGTLMLKRSQGNLVLVQKALNHAKPTMTLRYADMVKEDVTERVQQLSLLNDFFPATKRPSAAAS